MTQKVIPTQREIVMRERRFYCFQNRQDRQGNLLQSDIY